ncbi:ESPR-type extended signal peptide-containing protein [uncultured Megasphaera sp.]|uniref:ESPR-type extended signal peptide-containing protein n=1 Tax=uncultured Megasphaera sp. TaxID=165188 RepID=UPI0026006ACD|nr:ESPR-type extended signal peptide-containing protein [uncultured Megasphaera sp.]
MNRQYKVIWSKVKHCYIVVSELVKRNGKSSSVKSKSGQKIGVTLAVLALCFGLNGNSLAADLTEDQQAVYDAVIAKLQLGDGPGVAIGENSSTKKGTSVAIGKGASTTADNAVVIGTDASTEGGPSIAIGHGAKISKFNTSEAIAIGQGAESTNGSIVIGKNAKDYVTDPAKAGRGIFIGHDVKSYGNVSQVILGDHGEVKGQGAVAIGADTKALDEYAVAVGQFAEARAKSSSAIGSSSIAEEKGTAIGKQAKANEEGAVALGYNSKGNVEDGVSLGSYSIADREVGKIGYALGRDNSTVEKVLESVGQKARYDELTAIIEPLKDEYNALYTTYWNTPSGSAEETEAKQKLDNWKAEHPEYLPAVNEKKEIINTWQSGLGAVSVGRADFTRQITNVSAGTKDTDAVNVAQLKAVEYEGINFKGDGDAIIHRNLGTELIITGGNSDYTVLTDNNIGVVANEDTGSLTVKLSKNLNLSDGSVTFIEIAKNTDGNTLIKGENGKWYVDLTDAEYDADTQTYSKDGLKLTAVTNPVLDSVKLTSTGLNNGNQRIINVAAGTEEADAVNVSQLNALTQKVDKGAIHYVSVNGYGDKDSIDTNWKNDGAIGEGAVAIGHEAKAYGHESQAMGSSAWSIGNYSQSLGFYALAGIEPGIDQATYDALPVEEKKNYARLGMSMGGKDNTLYYRTTYKEYTMDEFMALSEEEQEALKNEKGYGYSRSRQIWARTPRSIAIGHLAKALGSTTVAIGNIAEATSTSSIAIGSMAKASGNYSFAAGDSAEAQNVGSIAIGKFAKAADYWGTAVGSYTIVEGEQGIALGVSAKAYTEKWVALGAASKAEREKGVIGYALGGDNSTFKKALESSGENVRYNKALETIASLKAEYDKLIIAYSSTDVGSAAEAEARKALDAWNAKHPEYLAAVKERDQMRNAWQSGFGAVSVGNEEATRQITNVAAGSEDSDAVNVAQLKALNNKLNNKISEEKVHYFSVNADDSESPDGTNWNNDGAAGKRAIAIGRNASTIGPGSIAIGDSAKIFNVNTQYALVIGENAESAHGSIVIGRYAKDYDTDPEQAGDGIFIGGEAKSLGGIAQVVLGNNGMVKGQGSIAIGQWAKAINYQSTAVGQDAKALGEVSSAFGAVSIAEDNYSMALGAYTNARGQSSLAVGRKNIAAGHNSIAIGNQSYAHNGYIYYNQYNALSPEEKEKYIEFNSIYFLKDMANGSGIKDTYLNTAVGSFSNAKKHAATFGGSSTAEEKGTAIGTYAKVTKEGAVALGYNSISNAENGVAIGAYSEANREKGKLGYALGGDNSSFEAVLESTGQKARYDALTATLNPLESEYNGLVDAINNATSTGRRNAAKRKLDAWLAEHTEYATALNEKQQIIDAWQSGNGAVSVGAVGATRQITNVAAGSEDTDAVNVAQLKALNTKVDDNSVKYFSVKPTYYDDNTELVDETVNADNQGATGNSSMAIGAGATTNAANSLAIGHKATISDDRANGQTAIGYKATASGQESVALGASASADSVSVALGGSAKSTSLGVAVGYNAKSNGSGGISVGNDAESNFRTVAVGVGAQGKSESSVAVGSEAATFADSSVATGSKSAVYGSGSIAIGTEAVVKSKVITPDEYNALSDDAKAGYVGAAYETDKFGQKTPTQYMKVENSGDFYNGMAIGTGAAVSSSNGMALGTVSRANGENSVAVGRRATSNVTDGVALGAWSVVDRENGAYGYTVDGVAYTSDEALAAYIGKAAEYQVANEEFYNNVALFNEKNEKLNNDPDNEDLKAEVAQAFDAAQVSFEKRNAIVNAYKSGLGAVSVGNAINTRQITGVAAGSEDTDAVNVAQLKALNTKVDTNKIEYVSINSSEEGNKLNDGAVAKDTIAIGPNVKTTVEAGVAIGRNIDSKGGVAVGEEAYSSSRHSVAIGYGAIAGDDLQADVAIGDGAKAREYSVAIGNGADAFMDPDPKSNGSGLAVAIGSGAKVKGQGSVAIGSGSLAEFSSSAMGIDAKANGRNAVSIGDRSNATGDSTVAIGTEAKTDSVYGVAIGPTAKGLGFGSVGIGGGAEATANWSMAMGQKAVASAQMGMALGHYSNVSSEKSTAVGSYASAAGGTNATAIGYKAKTTASSAVALGANSLADREGGTYGYTVDGVALSTAAEVAAYLGKTEEYRMANEDFNAKLAVFREKQSALQADPNNEQLKKEVNEAGAATQASFDARNAIVSAYRSGSGAVSVGSLGNTRQIINVAAGSEDTDAVNLAQLKTVETIAKAHTELTLDGKSATAGADGALGEYIGENNLTMAVKDVNGQKVYDLKLKNEVVIGQPGKDGKDGKPGSIGLVGPQGPAGEDGQPGKNAYAEISVKNGVDGVDGKHGKDGITRIVYEDEKGEERVVATMDDGLKFVGDTENVTIAKKLNETLEVKGGISDASMLTDNNIGVVAKADGGLTVRLAKNLNLNDGSVRIGGTTGDDGTVTGGIYIANQKDVPTTKDGKTEDGLFITGLANTDWDPDSNGIVESRAATEKQLKAVADSSAKVDATNLSDTNVNSWKTKLGITDTLLSDAGAWKLTVNGAGERSIKKDSVINFVNGEKVQITQSGNDINVGLDTEFVKQVSDNTTNITKLDNRVTKVEGDVTNVKKDITKINNDITNINQDITNINTKIETIEGKAGVANVVGDTETGVKVEKVDANDATKGVKVSLEEKIKVGGITIDGKLPSEGETANRTITGLTNTTWDADHVVDDRAATEGQLKDLSQKIKEVGEIKDGVRTYAGDDSGDNPLKRKNSEAMELRGGADSDNLSDNNIGVVTNKQKTGFDIKLSKDLKGLTSAEIGNVSISNNITVGTGDKKTVITDNSVTTGNTTINNDGLTIKNEDSSKNITIQTGNVNLGGNAIHNVGEATEANDAINKAQLDRTVTAIGAGMNEMSGRIGSLDRRVNRVGAGAAALAALHPLEYSPDAKWEVTAGLGNYRRTSAVALGAFYRPNYDTLFSIGASYGGGENMVNAGVTWRIGEGETKNYPSKQVMAQEIDTLKSALAQQNDKIESQSEQLEEQNKKIEQLMQAIEKLTK